MKHSLRARTWPPQGQRRSGRQSGTRSDDGAVERGEEKELPANPYTSPNPSPDPKFPEPDPNSDRMSVALRLDQNVIERRGREARFDHEEVAGPGVGHSLGNHLACRRRPRNEKGFQGWFRVGSSRVGCDLLDTVCFFT